MAAHGSCARARKTGSAAMSDLEAGPRSSLRQRVMLGLFGYALLLTVALVIHGLVVNEYVERLVWQTLLNTELDHLLERRRADPGYRWINSKAMALYQNQAQGPIPPALARLAPGMHDEVEVDGGERVVVLVREVDATRYFLTLDITALERRELDMTLTVIGSSLTLILLLGFAIAWGLNRLLLPLTNMALDIGTLQPDQAGRRINLPPSASSELVVIADSLNGYLDRNERFVERERAFIDAASHELRTPIAVIAGASALALEQTSVQGMARTQLLRIRRTVGDIEQLISLLLTLAKDPARLARGGDRVALEHLLPEIVDNHRHLTAGKNLIITIAPLCSCDVLAPMQIVQAAVGNLLRNAIEHSDRGEILISLQADATLIIRDPGHGMTPEEISALHAQLARGGGERAGGGIGLDLIAKLCEHLGWTLAFVSDRGRGTTTTLRFLPTK